jgi:hypothetical protein
LPTVNKIEIKELSKSLPLHNYNQYKGQRCSKSGSQNLVPKVLPLLNQEKPTSIVYSNDCILIADKKFHFYPVMDFSEWLLEMM